jgi:hypothetical protein
MSRVCLRIGKDSLCGAEVKEGDLETSRICEDCMQKAWKEEYRRRVLLPLSKSIDKEAVRQSLSESKEEEVEPAPIPKRKRIVLRDFQ